MKQIFPIDENGFVLWTSNRYRFESEGYKPKKDEVIVPIPTDTVFHIHRWDRKTKQWVEGKDHPNVPTMLEPESVPGSGIYHILEGDKPIEDMMKYFMALDVTSADVLGNSQYLCDDRLVPVLIKIVQDQQERLDKLEQGIKERGLK